MTVHVRLDDGGEAVGSSAFRGTGYLALFSEEDSKHLLWELDRVTRVRFDEVRIEQASNLPWVGGGGGYNDHTGLFLK